ncbi:AI-2E family transporter [Propionibacterium australiense]|uniref:Transmembrane protein TqsA-like n=1 Tax=Propionibacterium australiense TaxID=119981 RepID=A0A383S8Q3_9ACTN|nr:AI-2E family transporter [Propionibacterium australiense]SYZ34203.1 Transmembrane protein TqsA-like [Propionibacterium australiense]VEH89465.1 pheromone autoinducer 2 transporter [Propionibacterium australiense]
MADSTSDTSPRRRKGAFSGLPIGRRIPRLPGSERSDEQPERPNAQAPDAITLTAEQLTALRGASVESFVPRPLRVFAAWSWRILVVVAFGALLWWLGSRLSEVVIPLAVALLLTAALHPLNARLVRHHWPKWLASLSCLLLIVVIVLGLLSLVGAQIATQWSQLVDQTIAGARGFVTWLNSSPLHINADQIDSLISQTIEWVQNSRETIASAAATAGSSIGKFFAGAAMALFATFFFLKDGQRFVDAGTGLMPRTSRLTVMPAVVSGWASLSSYVRAAIAVAAVDGIGAGIGAAILGSNLWLAITALTFVCAFVPIIGAIASGVVAVAVTLVTLGFWKAVIMLAIFVAVMQLESHLLQPLLLGRAVSIHPLAVLVGIAVGLSVAGIVGGVFAIPIVAFVTGVLRASRSREGADEEITAADEVLDVEEQYAVSGDERDAESPEGRVTVVLGDGSEVSPQVPSTGPGRDDDASPADESSPGRP